ncbi:WD repeat-containing protein CG11141-like Protein [Tribolium castaneum]|uniref:WD repeat-containing protein CG11141-like Protein n=1 Tax=Tribolium castaneum TaxID=7070 RepID=D6WD97_TRICA|nr:PREDICTED: WD repeat-containing protein CG11141 [Tribolium castaneum]EEZ99531.1 WD repeat-containing protein CG11141-like Protein [Tribolium castaneum]|eukprot:XP_969871.2 PREDICTED: WD repeat-containing protein CG11141 [Tribolium castaneum]
MALCEYNNLKEWAPLTDLFSKLPTKVQNGLFTQDVKLTCLDVLPEFLALGTNVGLVYWYDRKKKDLQRLRCEKQNVQITVVRIISTVDFMVACGSTDGCINIFQIPKSHPDSIPDNLKPKSKQVERFTVSDLHKCPVTALEWSKNGMKLFSGDKNGCIVLTEIDFYMHICKSAEILNESYQVIQLSYSQQRLLVSTTYRSIICQRLDKWKVCQVGKKDRKILGPFGGLIHQNGPKTTDAVLYCTRPGLRIWVADCDGNVNKTLLFKDLLKKECSEVPIINPISRNLKMLKPLKEPSFGVLLPFSENLILTYNNDVIYVLDPEQMTIISTMSHFRSVLGVATHKDEIFILEEDRSVVRISYKPEQIPDCDQNSASPVASMFLPITTSLKDITTKLQTGNILPDVNIHTDESLIMNAEEAKESPIKTRANPEIEKKFNDIGRQQFEEKILYRQSNKHRKRMCASMSSLSSNSSEEKEGIKPTLMTLSSVGVLPDLRSPESIQNDIEYKERILADMLSLDTIKISLDQLQENNESCDDDLINEPTSSNPEHIPEISDEVVKDSSPLQSSKKQIVHNEAPPVCLNIPNDWKLADICLNVKTEPEVIPKNDTSLTDNSLADWEIV